LTFDLKSCSRLYGSSGLYAFVRPTASQSNIRRDGFTGRPALRRRRSPASIKRCPPPPPKTLALRTWTPNVICEPNVRNFLTGKAITKKSFVSSLPVSNLGSVASICSTSLQHFQAHGRNCKAQVRNANDSFNFSLPVKRSRRNPSLVPYR